MVIYTWLYTRCAHVLFFCVVFIGNDIFYHCCTIFDFSIGYPYNYKMTD